MTSEPATVFETDKPVDQTKKETPPVSNQDSIVNALVGDGKKFKTVEDLAKGKLEADNFIEEMKTEMAELRKDLSTSLRTAEAIEAIKKERDPSLRKAPDESEPVDMGKIVRDELTKAENEKIAIGNIREANDHLVTKLGGKDEAKKFLSEKSQELGIPVDWFMDMAAKSPKALYNTLGVDAPAPVAPKGPMKSDVNTLAKDLNSPRVKEGSKAYFDEIRKKDPGTYWTPRVQQQIMDAKKKGTYEI